MKKNLLAILSAFAFSGSANAATITPTQGLALDVSAGFSLEGLEALHIQNGIAANQMRFTVFSEFGTAGSVLSSRVLPFGGSGFGGIFLYSPDVDGDVSVLVTADFGTFDFQFASSSWDSLSCTGPLTCVNARRGVSISPNSAYEVDVAAVPLPASFAFLLGAIGALTGLRGRQRKKLGHLAETHA